MAAPSISKVTVSCLAGFSLIASPVGFSAQWELPVLPKFDSVNSVSFTTDNKFFAVFTPRAVTYWDPADVGQSQARPVRTISSPLVPSLQAPMPPPMTAERAFYYKVAIHGSPADVVDQYGRVLENYNYRRAMADEFDRARYRNGVQGKISAEVARITRTNFAEPFMYEGIATLGEYSFTKRSFPIVKLNASVQGADYLFYFNYNYGGEGFILTAGPIANATDFDWSVPMSESDGSALVKRTPDRRVTIRITYSVLPTAHRQDRFYLDLFVRSADVFDHGRLLGAIPKVSSQIAPPEIAASASRAAKSPTKQIGQYRYTASYTAYMTRAITGLITLTDVGIALSGEQPDGSRKETSATFVDAFARLTDEQANYSTREMRLWRANTTSATWGRKDFRIVWKPFWPDDYSSSLVFEDVQERDRFFTDLTNALNEWTAKYSAFSFAAGKVLVMCAVNRYLVPCPPTAPTTTPITSPTSDAAGTDSAPAAGAARQVADDKARASGMYVGRGGDFVELNADGTFVIQFRGQTMRGSYTIQGQDLTLKMPSDPRPARARLTSAGLIWPTGETYVKR